MKKSKHGIRDSITPPPFYQTSKTEYVWYCFVDIDGTGKKWHRTDFSAYSVEEAMAYKERYKNPNCDFTIRQVFSNPTLLIIEFTSFHQGIL